MKAEIKLEYELEVRDRRGRLISRQRRRARSLLKNFAGALRGLMYEGVQGQSVTLRDTGGTNRLYPNLNLGAGTSEILGINAGAGIDAYGLQVGTGSTAVTRDDYSLAAKINHGAGAGQLTYNASTVEAVDGTPPASQFRVIRTYTNSSGGSITVREIGLVAHENRTGAPADAYYLIIRDVLGTPIEVPDTCCLTARYIISVTA